MRPGGVAHSFTATAAGEAPPAQDKSVLFDILCKERVQEGGSAVEPATESKDPFFDLRHTLEQLNMSHPRRNGLKTNIESTAAVSSKLSTTSTSNGIGIDSSSTRTKTTRRNKPLDENQSSLCGAGGAASTSSAAASSSTDDERTMRLRSRNALAKRTVNGSSCPPSGGGSEDKRMSIHTKSRVVVSSGDEVRANRTQKGDASQVSSSLRNDSIRTTKTSRLRAAALGKRR